MISTDASMDTDPFGPDELRPFPLFRPAMTWADCIVAFCLSLLSLFVFSSTAAWWAFVGASGRQTSFLTGILPPPNPDNFLLIELGKVLTGAVGPEHAVATLCGATMLAAALAVGALYLLSLAFFRIILPDELMDIWSEDATRLVWRLSRAAATVAALAMTFSTPVWTMAGIINIEIFYLPVLLLCAHAIVRFIAEDCVWPVWIAAPVLGFLCAQSGHCVTYLFFLVLALIYGCLRSNRPWHVTFLLPAVLFLGAGLLTSGWVIANFTDSLGYELRQYSGPGAVFTDYMSGLINRAASPILDRGWLILFGFIFLPWGASVFLSQRAVANEPSRRFYPTHLLFLVACAITLLESEFSPWNMLGTSATVLLAYPLAAMCFGYTILAFRQHFFFSLLAAPLRIDEESDDEEEEGETVEDRDDKLETLEKHLAEKLPRWRRRLTVLPWLVAILFLTFEAWLSLPQARASIARNIRNYADEVLDNLEGRPLLLADEIFGELVRIRAYERGLPISVTTPHEAPTINGRLALRPFLEDAPALRNALDTDVFAFIRAFVERFPDADRRLALTLYPDLWNLGNFRPYPSGLIFTGVPAADEKTPYASVADETLSQDLARFLDTLARAEADLAQRPARFSNLTKHLEEELRARISFIGNNLACILELRDRAAEALTLLERLHAFDARNISVLLNLHALLERAENEEKAAQTLAEIRAVVEDPARSVTVWDLSRTQGYVFSTDAYALLGWTWSMAGQVPLALRTLDSALQDTESRKNAPAANRTALLLSIAGIRGRAGDLPTAENYFAEALNTDTNSVTATLGLYHARLGQKRFGEAEELLAHLQRISGDKTLLLREKSNLLLARGQTEEACKALYASLAENPENPESLLALFSARVVALSGEKDEAARQEIQHELSSLATRLRRNSRSRDYQGPIAMGTLHLLNERYAEARTEFRLAQQVSPGTPYLLRTILLLDYALEDARSARQTAHALLRIDPAYPFANYILGSLAAQANDWASAQEYLQTACDGWESPLPLGDLAYVRFRLGELNSAESLVRRALSLRDNIYELHDTYGQILAAKGNFDEAISSFHRALRIRPNDPAVCLHLADTLVSLGRTREAAPLLPHIEVAAEQFQGEDAKAFERVRELAGGASAANP